MPTTSEALAIAVLFLAPGLLYEWAAELVAGHRQPDSANKALQAFTRSVVAQCFLSPVVLLTWRHYQGMDFAELQLRELLPMFGASAMCVVLPILAGLLRGWAQKRRGTTTRSAWDAVFGQGDVRGYVRARLRSGTWVGGVYVRRHGAKSAGHGFASGYPQPESLYLPLQLVLDPITGEVQTGESGALTRDWGLLLHGNDIEFLEIQPFEDRRKAS